MTTRMSRIIKSAVITIIILSIFFTFNAGTYASAGLYAGAGTNAGAGTSMEAAAAAGAAAGAETTSSAMASFADVKLTDWAYIDIRKLAEASIISGDATEPPAAGNAIPPRAIPAKPYFRPDDTLSREECAVIITRLDSLMTDIYGTADLSTSIEPANPASFASSVNPTVPTNPARFADSVSPAEPANSASLAGSVSPAEPANSLDRQSFVDVPATIWSYQYIETAKTYIMGNAARYGNQMFYPGDPMVRGDFAAALMRLIGAGMPPTGTSALDAFTDVADISGEWKPLIAAAIEKSVLLGDTDKKLNLGDPVTRREACAIIIRALKGYVDFPEPNIRTLYVPDIDSGFYDEYFNGAVFIGDSITMGLRNHVLNERARGKELLGDARFLCAGSYGLKHAAADFNPDDVSLNYQGVNMPMEECILKMETKEVYLMLGMNDWAGASLPDSIIKYGIILDKVKSMNPDTVVYIQFCTPITTDREAAKLNNANTDKFNDAIVTMCNERGIDYVDVSTPMKDDNNALKREYASDNYVHMNSAGCEAWIGALREFVKGKYENNLWGPPGGAQPVETYPGSFIELD